LRRLAVIALLFLAAAGAPAQTRDIAISAPPELVESGLMDYILPRFSLKTGIRVALAPNAGMRIAADPPGSPVFRRDGTTYYLRAGTDDKPARFRDWLRGEIGRRTVETFVPEDGGRFVAIAPARPEKPAPSFAGDPERGLALAREHCGRCHVVNQANRMRGIGSTPSFGMLRTLPDWANRFASFHARNPHGAFTRIAGVTPPFPIDRPPPITPLDLTLDDLDDILAYVATVPPADLGAPIQYQ